MAFTLLLELFLLARTLCSTGRAPAPMRNRTYAGVNFGCTRTDTYGCLIIADPPAIAQQIPIPVFAPADASVAGLDRSNKALHVVVRTRKFVKTVTLEE